MKVLTKQDGSEPHALSRTGSSHATFSQGCSRHAGSSHQGFGQPGPNTDGRNTAGHDQRRFDPHRPTLRL